MYQIHYPRDLGAKFEQFDYPAGELQVRLKLDQLEAIAGATEIHVTATLANGNDLIGLALLLDALHHVCRYAHVSLILPYLPYGRADRRFTLGDCFGLRVFGSIIDGLACDQVVTIDAHSSIARGQIANLRNISPVPLIQGVVDSLDHVAVLLPDEGAKRYHANFKVFQGSKQRDAKTGKLSGFVVPEIPHSVKNLLIVDDICDGGGTFLGLAEEVRNHGFTGRLYLYVTHGIFSKGLGDLRECFHHIYTTNTFPHGYNAPQWLTVLPFEPLLYPPIAPVAP
jgi:ribose-phosphate pyrophosphokinase